MQIPAAVDVRLNLGNHNDSHVRVDGEDLPVAKVQRVSFDARQGEIPVTYIEVDPGVEPTEFFLAESFVRVGVPVESTEEVVDTQVAIVAFLEALDPDELEKAILDRVTESFGGEVATGEAALDIIRGWARGD